MRQIETEAKVPLKCPLSLPVSQMTLSMSLSHARQRKCTGHALLCTKSSVQEHSNSSFPSSSLRLPKAWHHVQNRERVIFNVNYRFKMFQHVSTVYTFGDLHGLVQTRRIFNRPFADYLSTPKLESWCVLLVHSMRSKKRSQIAIEKSGNAPSFQVCAGLVSISLRECLGYT